MKYDQWSQHARGLTVTIFCLASIRTPQVDNKLSSGAWWRLYCLLTCCHSNRSIVYTLLLYTFKRHTHRNTSNMPQAKAPCWWSKRWILLLQAADLRANSWATAVRPAILETAYAKGSDCFDDGFYVSSGPVELQFILEAPDRKAAAFDHFINGGLSEGRPYKFLCWDWKLVISSLCMPRMKMDD